MACNRRHSRLIFVMKEIGKGALQAIGSLTVYLLVLWLVFSKLLKNSNGLIARALAMKAPGLAFQTPEGKQQIQMRQQSST